MHVFGYISYQIRILMYPACILKDTRILMYPDVSQTYLTCSVTFLSLRVAACRSISTMHFNYVDKTRASRTIRASAHPLVRIRASRTEPAGPGPSLHASTVSLVDPFSKRVSGSWRAV
jgi:hypothetical protein